MSMVNLNIFGQWTVRLWCFMVQNINLAMNFLFELGIEYLVVDKLLVRKKSYLFSYFQTKSFLMDCFIIRIISFEKSNLCLNDYH